MQMTRLQALRKERGYTQIKMQMLTGIDQSDYSKQKPAIIIEIIRPWDLPRAEGNL